MNIKIFSVTNIRRKFGKVICKFTIYGILKTFNNIRLVIYVSYDISYEIYFLYYLFISSINNTLKRFIDYILHQIMLLYITIYV